MVFDEVILSLLGSHPYLLSFIAGFLAEEIWLFVSFLAGQGIIDFWSVFIFGFLGALCIDSIYYLIGLTHFYHTHIAERFFSKKASKLLQKIEKLSRNNMFLSFVITKFVYGPRMIYGMHLGYIRTPYKKFILYDILAICIWCIVLMPLAYLAGIGVLSSFSAVKKVELLIMGGIVFVLILYFITTSIFYKIIKKMNGIKN